MKKTIILILFLLLSSCSNNTIDETENKILTNTWNTIQEEIIEEVFENDSSVELEKLSFDSYTLKWSIWKDIEKVEIVWQNWDKEDSYLLKKYEKWSENFLSNLKFSYWNLWIWINRYIIKWYIWDEVVEEKEYTFKIVSNWCEVGLKSLYPKYFTKSWNTEIKKFIFSFPWDCKEKIIVESESWWLWFTFPNWGWITIIDYGLEPAFWPMFRWLKDKEKIVWKNINWKDYSINVYQIYESYIDENFEEILTTPKDEYFLSSSFEFSSMLTFWISSKWEKLYENIEIMKSILDTIQELEKEITTFNYESVDIKKDIRIHKNTFLLTDKYWNEKTINHELGEEYINRWYKDFEDFIKEPVSKADIEFLSLNWKELKIQIYQWTPRRWADIHTYIIDINTWKTILEDYYRELWEDDWVFN